MEIKYISSILLFTIFLNSLVGQDTIKIDDIFKKRESQDKKSYSNKNSTKKEKIVVEFSQILDDYAYYIESEYCLKSGKNTYGKNGNSSFGSKTGMGICVGEDIWTDEWLKNPWNYDEEYGEVKDEYKAVHSRLKIQKINKNEILNYKPDNYKFDDSSSVYAKLKIKKFKGNAFPISHKFIPNGMLVLYYNKLSDSTSNLDKKAFFVTPDWDEMFGYDSELLNKDVVGGFFLNYSFEGTSINFSLAGMVSSFLEENEILRKIVPFNTPPKKSTQEDKNVEKSKQKAKKSKSNITEIKDKN